MKQTLTSGDNVIWRRENGYAYGTIISIETGFDPIVTVQVRDNGQIVKLASELQGTSD